MNNRNVIFLGAGASYGSGYPSANELRLALCAFDYFQHMLERSWKYDLNGVVLTDQLNQRAGKTQLLFKRYKASIELFRNGGYGSVDEFAHASRKAEDQTHVSNMKHLMTEILLMVRPELVFTNSEYYSFVQSLFGDDSLTLKPDITIITYNYDFYLEYLICRAMKHRALACGGSTTYSCEDFTRASGGYIHGGAKPFDALFAYSNFTVLKLHGSTFRPNEIGKGLENVEYQFGLADVLFREGRHSDKDPHWSRNVSDSVRFPWEVSGMMGKLPEPEGFGLDFFFGNLEENIRTLEYASWLTARSHLFQADRIAFVGLSANHLLHPGWKWLFRGFKANWAAQLKQVSICNPSKEHRDNLFTSLVHCGGRAMDRPLNANSVWRKDYAFFSDFIQGRPVSGL